MDKELKAKWIEALRSGKYTQCRGQLYEEGVGHCCLGVLQQLMSGKTPPGRWGYDNPRPEKWPLEERGHDEAKLAEMNDGGKSFATIADYIEKAPW